jgi:cytosolic carboxypeptidase protein 2/3
VFESRFETGNLLAAIKVSDSEYDLFLQNDINTNGHTQWFFFRAGNVRKGQTVKFNILNLAKPDSLYNHGMKVLSYSSLKRSGEEEIGWHRVGTDINYF